MWKKLIMEYIKEYNAINSNISVKIDNGTSLQSKDYRKDILKAERCSYNFFTKKKPYCIGNGIIYQLEKEYLQKYVIVESKDRYNTLYNKGIESCFLIGYGEICAEEWYFKLKIINFEINLIKKLYSSFKIPIIIEITGIETNGINRNNYLSLGKINPESQDVINIVNYLEMNKLDNAFEKHTLGPIYILK